MAVLHSQDVIIQLYPITIGNPPPRYWLRQSDGPFGKIVEPRVQEQVCGGHAVRLDDARGGRRTIANVLEEVLNPSLGSESPPAACEMSASLVSLPKSSMAAIGQERQFLRTQSLFSLGLTWAIVRRAKEMPFAADYMLWTPHGRAVRRASLAMVRAANNDQ